MTRRRRRRGTEEPTQHDAAPRPDRHPRAGTPRRLCPATRRGRGEARRDAADLRRDTAARRRLRPGARPHQGRARVRLEQGGLPARQLRQRQEPLHGRAPPAAAAAGGGPRRRGSRRRRHAARRLARRQALPARALSHDREAEPRCGGAGGLCGAGRRAAPGRAHAGRLPQRGALRRRAAAARGDRRRDVLRPRERDRREHRRCRRRVGQSVGAVGCRELRGGARRPGRGRGAQPPRRRASRLVLPWLPGRGAGEQRGVRSPRRGAGGDRATRA